MGLVLSFISTFILSLSEVYVWYSLDGKKYPFKIKSIYLKTMLLTILTLLNYQFINSFIKGIVMIILAIIFCKWILHKSLKECVLLSFLGQLIVIVAEAISIFFISIFSSFNISSILESSSISFVLDIFITFLIITIAKLNILNKLYNMLIRITSEIKSYQVLIFIMFVVLGSAVFCYSIYFNDNLFFVLILNISVSILYTIVVILVFNYQSRYYKISYKYNISLDNLQAQESIINEYRIINHENKNQLLTIKSMTKNKQIIGYIDSLISQNQAVKNQIINSTLKLPEGGIRGLIYSKMLYMKEKNIDCYLNVDKRITSKILSNIDDNDIVDICHILGVFIDNSIEETLYLDDKKINIDLHLSTETLSINISNNHKQSFELNKSNQILKTTKGKGHGYGLALVKRIVDKNKRLINNRKITKETFTQELVIKLN